jgi:hypothetical protein
MLRAWRYIGHHAARRPTCYRLHLMTHDAPTEPTLLPAGVSHAAGQPTGTALPLYRRVLGADWDALDPAVRSAHDAPGDQQATGTFAITRSPNWLYGLILNLAGVPAASAGASVSLRVQPDGLAELWQRTFNGRPLQSRQYATPGGHLAEQFGPFEFWFWLGADNGALRFRHARQFLRLGPLRLPLPHWAAPHIAARESAGRTEDETSLAVRVTTSTADLLFAYAGVVRWSHIGQPDADPATPTYPGSPTHPATSDDPEDARR